MFILVLFSYFALQPDVHPGQCWAFKGDNGYVVIQLSVPIRPTGFSLEHIPKSLSPTGSIDSAPKDFTVFVRKLDIFCIIEGF
jgi:SUN domain-containing protein 1/2